LELDYHAVGWHGVFNCNYLEGDHVLAHHGSDRRDIRGRREPRWLMSLR
jgi:hypothetical protein